MPPLRVVKRSKDLNATNPQSRPRGRLNAIQVPAQCADDNREHFVPHKQPTRKLTVDPMANRRSDKYRRQVRQDEHERRSCYGTGSGKNKSGEGNCQKMTAALRYKRSAQKLKKLRPLSGGLLANVTLFLKVASSVEVALLR